MPPAPRRGEVWLANLNPGKGTEPGTVRPVLLVQNQALLDAEHPSTLVVPLTTNRVGGAEPLRLRVAARDRLDRESELLVDQLRAIDNRRLIDGPLARLDAGELRQVDAAVAEVLGLGEPG